MSLISVIVPIYNVEKYLTRALDSILAQTYHNWEAILVDDGSTDRSGSIADEYAQKDERFKVIHKENGGLSDARNVGMEHVTGEYLIFLDSDDFLHPQLMELCIQAAQRDSSDLVAFTYDRVYRTKNLILHFLHLPESKPCFRTYKNPPYRITDNIFDYATEWSHPKNIDARWAIKHCQVWRCMYKTDTIRNISFITGINYEDFPWWSEVLLHINRCTILNLPLYFYYPNPNSYIFSAEQTHKIESLRKGVEAGIKLYATAPDSKRTAWEQNFMEPFMHKVHEKEKKLFR